MSELSPESAASVDGDSTATTVGGDAEPGGDSAAAGTPAKKGPRKGSFFRELPFLVLVALVLALLIKAFLVQAFFIPSGSMENTLRIKDRVLVNKLVYDFRDPHRGEIVVFNGSGTGFCPGGPCKQESSAYLGKPTSFLGKLRQGVQRVLGFGAPSEKDFIKRVIGLPGDTVACCDSKGRVTVNRVPLDEPYILNTSGGTPTSEFSKCMDHKGANLSPCTVPKGELFVMGDHRDQSSDSRVSGAIPISKVVGRAFVVIWPAGHAKGLRVPRSIERAKAAAVGALTPPVLGLLGALPIAVLRRRLRRRPRRSHP
jgi:signal peptidase I